MSSASPVTSSPQNGVRGSARMSANGGKDGGPDEEETSETRRRNYVTICRFLLDGVPIAVRHIFNQFHPQISLVNHLAQPNTHKTLRRLKVQKVLNSDQWTQLYPTNKRIVTSNNFDAILLYMLLRHICPISEPYPGGWDEVPEAGDHSLGAELTRVHVYLKTISSMTSELPNAEFEVFWGNLEQLFASLMLGESASKTQNTTNLMKRSVSVSAGRQRQRLLKTPQAIANLARDIHNDTQNNTQANEEYIAAVKDWRGMFDALSDKHKHIERMHAKRQESHELVALAAEFVGGSGGQGGTDARRRSKTAPPSRSQSILSNTGHMGSIAEDQPRVELTKAMEKDIIAKYQKRLTEDIRSEDVVGRLVQQGVLSHEDKSNVALQMTNQRCMNMVLDLIIQKGGRSFDIFCDVIKFRYKGIYNILTEAKKTPFLITRPDEGSELAAALKFQMQHVLLSGLSPVPWCTHVQLPLSDFYQPLFIVDLKGKQVQPLDIFQPNSKSTNPKRVLIEGETGVGKSTLLKYIAEQWTLNLTPQFTEKFKLVVYVDLRSTQGGNLLETVVQQCLPDHYKKTSDELYNVFKIYQKRLLFLLDGYECINTLEDEFLDLLHRAMFRECYVVMVTRSHQVSRALLKQFDSRFLVTGIQHKAREALIEKYAKLTECSLQDLSPLIENLQAPEPSLVHMYSANPTLCMCLCLMARYEPSFNFTNLTGLIERTIKALEERYCVENKIKNRNTKVKEQLKNTMCTFEEIAFENLMDNRVAFNLDTELNKYNSEDLHKYGMLASTRHRSATYTYFTSAFFQDFLAARFMTRIEEYDFPRYIEALAGDKYLQGLLQCFFGLRSADYENEQCTQLLKTICSGYGDAMVIYNLNGHAGHKDTEDTESLSSSVSRQTESRDITAKQGTVVVEGRLSDYYHALKCLAQCEGREDLAKIVVQSLPGKLYTKSMDFIQPEAVLGLASVIEFNSPKITELDLRLDPIGYYYSYALVRFACAIETSGNIHTLRMRWTSDNLLALFVAGVFGKNMSISTLKIYDESRLERDNITATVWANFWSARHGMQHIELFSFTECKNPALVSSVIHNLPSHLVEVSLRGCSLDMVSMQELCSKLENARALRIVHLNAIGFKKADFGHLARGIKHTRTLLTLSLAQTDIDSGCIIALSEALKFNRSLRDLDLSETTLDKDACKSLGLALALNKTIHSVDLTGAKIAPLQVEDMQRAKRENVVLVGVKPLREKNAGNDVEEEGGEEKKK